MRITQRSTFELSVHMRPRYISTRQDTVKSKPRRAGRSNDVHEVYGAARTLDMTSEFDAAASTALTIFGEDSPLKPLVEQYGKTTADALGKHAERWFQRRIDRLWNAAQERVCHSGRDWTEPRVQAAIEITKHGVAEERHDLREAYENLAARSMTEDEWEHDYEEYARRLSRLKPGDISVLCAVRSHSMLFGDFHLVQVDLLAENVTSTRTDHSGNERTIITSSLLLDSSETAQLELMGSIDRLVVNRLLLVGIFDVAEGHVSTATTGQNIDWPFTMGDNVPRPDLTAVSVAPSQVGVDFLTHIADLEPIDQPEDA